MTQCTAKSKRSKKQCQKWAVRGHTTCHMHGGTSKGPKTKQGKAASRQAALRHGWYTKQAKAHHQEILSLIKKAKEYL